MKRLLLIVALLAAWSAAAQPLLRNTFTTNSNQIFGTTTSPLYPLMIDSDTGTVSANGVQFSPSFSMSGTNGLLYGILRAGGGIFTNQFGFESGAATGWVLRSTDANGTGQWTTNVDVLNITNLTVVNNFNIKGKAVSFTSANGTNVQQLNLKDSATVTWAYDGGSNVTAVAAAGTGDTTATNIVTLTMSGTNVSAMDYSLVQRGGVFKLVLTGNGYIGAPSGVANTAFTHAWLMVQQPSTGTCLLAFTNGFYAFPEGVAPLLDTNAGAVTVFEFTSDVFTNGLLHGFMSLKSKLIP